MAGKNALFLPPVSAFEENSSANFKHPLLHERLKEVIGDKLHEKKKISWRLKNLEHFLSKKTIEILKIPLISIRKENYKKKQKKEDARERQREKVECKKET